MGHHVSLSVPGDKEGAQAAYDEALNAVFNLEVQCHRHTQLQKSKDGIGTRWSMIEMWPMLVIIPTALFVLGHYRLWLSL